jgi:hypothetical protein
MSKLKLAFALPMINLVAAVAILHQPVGSVHFGPPLLLEVCWGLNAPAFLFWNHDIPGPIEQLVPTWLLSALSGELYYVVGILITWSFIGNELDRRNSLPGDRKRVVGLAVDSLMLVAGGVLFWMGIEDCNSPHTEFYSAFHGPSVKGMFFFAWSLALIYVSAKRFATTIRRRRLLSGGGQPEVTPSPTR